MIDVPAQLHRLQQQAVLVAEKVVLLNLPALLSRRISANQLQWKDLSGFLQRALLWDIGLVLTGEGKLVQVYVPCGKSMGQIFLPRQVFDPTTCDVGNCYSNRSVHATTTTTAYIASRNCSRNVIVSVAQCAIEDAVTGISDNSALWAEDGGNITTVPDIRIYRNIVSMAANAAANTSASALTNESSPVLYTIHEQQTTLASPEDCPTQSFFTAPCVQRTLTNHNEWCPPERGGFVDLWLDAEFAPSKGETGTGVSSLSLIILIVLVVATVFGAIIALVVLRRRRRERLRTLTTAVDDAAEIPTLAAAEYRPSAPSLLDYPSQVMIPNLIKVASVASDIAALNESICRRSIETMSTFCSDGVLMAKRVPYAALYFETMLARGANGEVWRGEYSGQVVAIKNLLPEKQHDKNAIEQFAKEIRLASTLEHPNIVKFVGFSWKRLSDLCSISEFMGKGDLSDLINSTLSGRMTWNQEKLSIAIDIANALAYLHSLKPLIIHRDLKSLNVLLNDNLEAKLSDFGLSRARSFEETMTSGIGTLLWTAPEILRGEAYSEKADIFSYGIVLSELDTCLPPYALNDEVSKQQLTSMQLINLVAKGRIKPRFRGDCPRALERLATSCVAEDPSTRPNAMQLVAALRSKGIVSHVSIR